MSGVGRAHEALRLQGLHLGPILDEVEPNRVRVCVPEVNASEPRRLEDRQAVSKAPLPNSISTFRNVVNLVNQRIALIDEQLVRALWRHIVKYLFEYLVFTRL